MLTYENKLEALRSALDHHVNTNPHSLVGDDDDFDMTVIGYAEAYLTAEGMTDQDAIALLIKYPRMLDERVSVGTLKEEIISTLRALVVEDLVKEYEPKLQALLASTPKP